MQIKELLSEERIRRDLYEKASLKRIEYLMLFLFLPAPFLGFALLLAVFDAWWWALALLAFPVAICLSEVLLRRKKCRLYASMPILLYEERINEILYAVRDEKPLIFYLGSNRSVRKNPARDYYVFNSHGRVEIPQGLSYLSRDEYCYLVCTPDDTVVLLYARDAWRPAEELRVYKPGPNAEVPDAAE